MLSVQQAESIIFNLVQPLDHQRDREIIELSASLNRVLAAPVTSKLDFPHWDNSAMDGYALRYADVQNCDAAKPAVLAIIEEIPAGYQPKQTIQSGQAARIFTGGVMPDGADTVVMQERTGREGDRVFIFTAPEPGAFVRRQGSFYQAGACILPAGTVLKAPEIAVLAAAQCTQFPVYRRPRVAILSTGNELVTPDQPLQPSQLVDSNQYALAAAVVASGGEAQLLGIVPDEPAALRKAIAQAITSADVVISTGGVSVGDYDYVEEILTQLGGEIHIQSVAIKPGKPLTVASFKSPAQVLYFGLPGNPVSALVTFWRFVQPALRKLAGLVQGWEPVFIQARSQQDLRSDGKRETYLWGQLQAVAGIFEFQVASGSHSSGNLINLAQTNALAVVPVGQTLIPAGELVQVLAIS